MYHQNLFFVIKPTNIDLPNTIPYDKIPYGSDNMIFCDYFEGYFYYNIDSYNYNNLNDNNSLIYKQYTDFMHTDDYLGYISFARMPKKCYSYDGTYYNETPLSPDFTFYVYNYISTGCTFFVN